MLSAAGSRDFSYDGQQYHQLAIWVMAEGWNPLYDAPVSGLHSLWINGYAKGPWTWSAAWLDATGSIETGKSLHLWLASSAGLLAFASLSRFTSLRPGLAATLAALAAVNPVLAYQWPTHMNDSLIGSLLLVLASQAATMATCRRDEADWWPALASSGLALALLPTIKLSGLAYAVLVVSGAIGLLLLSRRADLLRPLLAVGAGSVTAACILLAWNPYASNTLRHGHPLHPLAGPGKVDIITGNSPAGIQEHGRVVQLLGSLFSSSHSDLGETVPSALRPKWPGVVQPSELRAFFSKTDMRIGGFGPWFSLALLLAVVAAALALRHAGTRTRVTAMLLPAAILALAIVFPEPWWARYVPQLALLPVVLSTVAFVLAVQGSAARRVAAAAVGVLAVNASLVAGLHGVGVVVRQLDAQTQLDSLAALSSTRPLAVRWREEPALVLRLEAAGLRWREPSANEPCSRWIVVHHSTVQVCLPESAGDHYRDASPLVERLKSLLSG